MLRKRSKVNVTRVNAGSMANRDYMAQQTLDFQQKQGQNLGYLEEFNAYNRAGSESNQDYLAQQGLESSQNQAENQQYLDEFNAYNRAGADSNRRFS